MLRLSLIFLIISLGAAILGYSRVASGTAEMGRVAFFIFLSLFLISLIVGLLTERGWDRLFE